MPVLESLARPLLIAAVVVLLLLAFLYLTQRSLIYFPGSTPPAADLLPPGAETIELRTDDGLRLPGWFLPPTDRRGQAADEAAPAIMIFNGNAGDRSHGCRSPPP
jgi:hypothetical protein